MLSSARIQEPFNIVPVLFSIVAEKQKVCSLACFSGSEAAHFAKISLQLVQIISFDIQHIYIEFYRSNCIYMEKMMYCLSFVQVCSFVHFPFLNFCRD